jgi:hypothetical protein
MTTKDTQGTVQRLRIATTTMMTTEETQDVLPRLFQSSGADIEGNGDDVTSVWSMMPTWYLEPP